MDLNKFGIGKRYEKEIPLSSRTFCWVHGVSILIGLGFSGFGAYGWHAWRSGHVVPGSLVEWVIYNQKHMHGHPTPEALLFLIPFGLCWAGCSVRWLIQTKGGTKR